MALFAHVTNGSIDVVGEPPLLLDDGKRWWDLRTRDLATLAALGWYPVTLTPRPADTATTTTDYAVSLVGGVPTEVWTARPLTAEELAAQTAAQNGATIANKIQTVDMPAMDALLAATNNTLNNGPAPYLKDIAKAVRRLDRKVARLLDGTD